MVRSPKKTKALIEAKEKLEKEKLEKEKVEKEKVKSAWEGFGDPDRKPQPINAGRLVDEVRNLQLHLRSVVLEKRKKKCDNKKNLSQLELPGRGNTRGEAGRPPTHHLR